MSPERMFGFLLGIIALVVVVLLAFAIIDRI